MARGFIKKSYYHLAQGENAVRHPLLLLIRLYWGSLFFLTGLGKLLNIPATAHFFSDYSIPYPYAMVVMVGCLELLGGISLVLGFLSRIFSLILVGILCMAFVLAHTSAVENILTSPTTFTSEEPFLYLFAALLVLALGPGAFSVDYWMEKRLFGRGL